MLLISWAFRPFVSSLERAPKMAHNLEMKDGVYSFAFTGDRDAIWHRLGQQLPADVDRATWIAAAGFDYRVEKVQAIAALDGAAFDHIDPSKRMAPTDMRFLVRQDNGHVLGFASDSYQVVQPGDIWDWFERYVTADDRFHIDAAGVLHHGEKLWATAKFNGDMQVGGDRHVARLLMSTSFDCSQPTINQGTMTRTVCANTLRVAHADSRAAIRTRHSTRFDGESVARELAQIATSFASYKAMGDVMAQTVVTQKTLSDFFGKLLDIKPDAKPSEISGRKQNMQRDLEAAYRTTQRERNSNQDDAWTALQAVTRYVDHDRSVRNADNAVVGRFDSGTWGSGDAMKGRAMELLRALVPA
jgi:phage/plasmid-like protein (TIGR03299 family)